MPMAGGVSPSGLADVIDTILDKGLVIDAYIRVSLVGIEVLTIDARVVVASVETYLRFAEAVSRLDLSQENAGLPDLVGAGAGKLVESVAKRKTKRKTKHKTKGMLETAGEKLLETAGEKLLETAGEKLSELVEDLQGEQRPRRSREAVQEG